MKCSDCLCDMKEKELFFFCPECGDRVEKDQNKDAGDDSSKLAEEKKASRYIFLSYGHDDYAKFAFRLCDSLKERGHDVWTDLELKIGLDWEAQIEKALNSLIDKKNESCFILLMTHHSVRRPDGYCLNELAKVLGDGVFVVPVKLQDIATPLSIARIQHIDMRQCLSFELDDAEYKRQVDILLKAVENKIFENGDVQSQLNFKLKPLEFTTQIKQYSERFVGREWILEGINEWIKNPQSSQVFWLKGAPGIGKTAISVWLSCAKLNSIKAWHFCQHSDIVKSSPKRCIMSIAYHLSTQLPEYMEELIQIDLDKIVSYGEEHAESIFQEILIEPLNKISDPKSPIIILIDALDEAQNTNSENLLAKFIGTQFKKFPKWFKLIVTSRSVIEIEKWFRELKPLFLDASLENNINDIRLFSQSRFKSLLENSQDKNYTKEQESIIIENIVAKSEGVFLYVEKLFDAIETGDISIDEPNEFPNGLYSIYEVYFKRRFSSYEHYKNHIVPLLELILVSLEPMQADEINEYLEKSYPNYTDRTLKKLLEELGSILIKTNNTIVPFHKSISDWLTIDEYSDYFIAKKSGEEKVIKWWETYSQNISKAPLYLIKYIIHHLLSCGKIEESIQMLTSEDLFNAQLNSLGIDISIENYFKNLYELARKDKNAINQIYQSKFFHNLLVKYYRYLSDFAYYFDLNVLNFAEYIKNTRENSISVNCVFVMYLYALESFEQAIELAEQIFESDDFSSLSLDFKAQLSETYGLSNRKLGKFDIAMRAFENTVTYAKEDDNSFQLSLGYANLAKIEYHYLDFQKAYESNKEAIKFLFKTIENEQALMKKDNEITRLKLFFAEYKRLAAETYIWGMQYAEAQEHLDYAKNEIYDKLLSRDRFYVRYLYTSSFLNIFLGNLALAQEELEKAKTLCKSKYDTATVKYYKALLLILQKEEKDLALKEIHDAIKIYSDLSSIIELVEVKILEAFVNNTSVEDVINNTQENYAWYEYVANYFKQKLECL